KAGPRGAWIGIPPDMAVSMKPGQWPLLQRAHARFDAWVRRRTPAALPVRFDRHRIYILPTRFGAFFTALLLVMGVGALNYNNNPALLLCLLLAGAAIA